MAGVIAVNADAVEFTRTFGMGKNPILKTREPWTLPGEGYRKNAFEAGVDYETFMRNKKWKPFERLEYPPGYPFCDYIQKEKGAALNDSEKYNTNAGKKCPCNHEFNGPQTDMTRDPLTDQSGDSKQ